MKATKKSTTPNSKYEIDPTELGLSPDFGGKSPGGLGNH
jgi:hypothetical protein